MPGQDQFLDLLLKLGKPMKVVDLHLFVNIRESLLTSQFIINLMNLIDGRLQLVLYLL